MRSPEIFHRKCIRVRRAVLVKENEEWIEQPFSLSMNQGLAEEGKAGGQIPPMKEARPHKNL